MTMVNTGPGFWPTPFLSPGSTSVYGAASNIAFDSTTDRLGWLGRFWGANDSIASIKFYVGTIAASAGCGVQVRIETVSNGRPSGTLWAANTFANVVVADTDDNSWKTATLTAPASMVAGDEFAIVIIYNAGNDDGSFSVQFKGTPTFTSLNGMYPVTLQDTGGGTWAAGPTGWEWIVTLTTRGATYFSGMLPIVNVPTISVLNNGSASDERALRFRSAVPRRLTGARVYLCNLTAAGLLQICLWDASGNEVGEELASSSALDTDFAFAATDDGYLDIFFTAPYTIAKDTTYYLGLKSLSATNISLVEFPVSLAADKGAFPIPNGSDFYGAVRTWDESQTPDLAGAWTESDVTLPAIHLMFDQLDDGTGSSSGGGLRLAGMGGLAS